MAAIDRRLIVRGAIGLAAVLALTACDKLPGAAGKGAAFKGVDITGANYARTLSMSDADGKPRSLDEFKGKVVMVFFGFTQCPDVCPTTLAELAQAKRDLGADGDKVQGIFVSVDPERDTAPVIKAYVSAFDPGFVALRGTLDETKAAATEFKVFFAKVPGKTEGSYTIDHTAGAYLFDPQGRVRLFTRYGSGSAALTDDIRLLLKGA